MKKPPPNTITPENKPSSPGVSEIDPNINAVSTALHFPGAAEIP